MKTTSEYKVFVDKQTRRIVGREIDVPTSMEDRFEEIELPDPMKKLVDKIKEWKLKRNE